MSGRKPPLAVWRDAVRDSGLDSTAKLVAYTLSTYMSGGFPSAYPAVGTLAARCGLVDRTVQKAVRRIESAGYLVVSWSHGKSTNTYFAIVPPAAGDALWAEWLSATAKLTSSTPKLTSLTPSSRSPESAESAESSRGGSPGGAAAAICPECATGAGLHAVDCPKTGAA